MNKLIRRLFNRTIYTKVLDVRGEYYYIDEIADPFKGGWLLLPEFRGKFLTKQVWLPFVFWKVKHGLSEPATEAEVADYRKYQANV